MPVAQCTLEWGRLTVVTFCVGHAYVCCLFDKEDVCVGVVVLLAAATALFADSRMDVVTAVRPCISETKKRWCFDRSYVYATLAGLIVCLMFAQVLRSHTALEASIQFVIVAHGRSLAHAPGTCRVHVLMWLA